MRLDAITPSLYNNLACAGVAELADAEDLKSSGAILESSSLSSGTTRSYLKKNLLSLEGNNSAQLTIRFVIDFTELKAIKSISPN